MSANLKISQQGRVLRVTLNRPEKRNALDTSLCRALLDVFRHASRDRSIGAVVLDAEGPAFCAGMDLAEDLEADQEDVIALQHGLFTRGLTMRKPVVAAVQGAAIAGGMGLALNSHIVVAAEDAVFALTEVRIGLWPYLIFQSVAAAVGIRRAVDFALTARTIGAREAERLGIVNQIVPAAQLTDTAIAIAQKISESSAQAIAGGLAFVEQLHKLTTPESAEIAMQHRRNAHNTVDFAEGVKAFREKRAPRWPSHG